MASLRHCMAIVAILALSGCYVTPRIIDVGPDTVSIGYDTRFVTEPEAVARAQQYCRDRGRRAVPDSRKDYPGAVVLKFRCERL